MVLIEVVKLIVDVDWGLDVRVNFYVDLTLLTSAYVAHIVLLHNGLDALTHHVQSDAQGQEDQA